MAQTFIVALLVAGCFVYAVWTMSPKVLRSRCAVALLNLPLPLLLQRPLTAAARQQGGCACDGCDRSARAKPRPGQPSVTVQAQAVSKPLTFVRGNYLKKPTD